MLWAPAAGSDWIHQHEDGKPRRSEGHAASVPQNKAMKYIYKQHNKHGNPQRRPPLQQQQCPGWGILYMCHRKLQSQPTGGHGHNPRRPQSVKRRKTDSTTDSRKCWGATSTATTNRANESRPESNHEKPLSQPPESHDHHHQHASILPNSLVCRLWRSKSSPLASAPSVTWSASLESRFSGVSARRCHLCTPTNIPSLRS